MIDILLNDDKTSHLPGEAVSGILRWQYERQLKAIELRLLWKTVGKGNPDTGLADSKIFRDPETHSEVTFELNFPSGPYSFSGKLISITWRLEAVTDPSTERCIRDLVMSPTGKEIGSDDWKLFIPGGFLQP